VAPRTGTSLPLLNGLYANEQTIYGKSSTTLVDSSQLESVTVEPTKQTGFSYPVGQMLPDGTIMAIPKLQKRWSDESGEILVDRIRSGPLQQRKSFRAALISKPVCPPYLLYLLDLG